MSARHPTVARPHVREAQLLITATERPTLDPTLVHALLPSVDDVLPTLENEYEERIAKAAARRPHGGYNAGYRCFDCKRFVSGRESTCGSCGYQHGGQNHYAVATR